MHTCSTDAVTLLARLQIVTGQILRLKNFLVIVPLGFHLLRVCGDHEAHLAGGLEQKLRATVLVHACLDAARFENVEAQAELLDLVEDHLAH